jgi:hypothetical protein
MPLFAMIAHDRPHSAAARDAHRAAHVAHVESLDREGRILLAGPIKNDAGDKSIGAIIVFEAPDLPSARDLVNCDPYVKGGVFQTVTVAPFKKAYPARS